MHARGRASGPPARSARRILIVEDEPALLRALRINFRARGYEVAVARDGGAALAEIREQSPDAILLDLGLPDLDGIEIIRRLRGFSRAPVIVISGRTGSDDRIGALDAGADDYVTKPFSMEELMLRLRAALRPGDQGSLASVRIGRCVIDLAGRTITRLPEPGQGADGADGAPGAAGAPVATGAGGAGGAASPAGAAGVVGAAGVSAQVHLTDIEWRLLEVLVSAPGQLISSERLLSEVFATNSGAGSDSRVRFQMARLRRKLEEDPPRPRHLLTEPGIGYRYRP